MLEFRLPNIDRTEELKKLLRERERNKKEKIY